jgi:AcrR family transcriptional regulator
MYINGVYLKGVLDMVRPTKEEQIPNLAEAIKDAAWDQIAKNGAAALSLRAIARDLGITAPAIYNYFRRRDDLVTALIVDAFTSLGESQREACDSLPEIDLPGRLSALGLAYREWAITYPQRYQLIFGTPIPGYEAPADTTIPAASWALMPLLAVIYALSQTGILKTEDPPMSPELAEMMENWSKFSDDLPTEVLYLGLVIWSRVHGLVMLEIGNQMPSFITDPGEIFRREIAALHSQFICK